MTSLKAISTLRKRSKLLVLLAFLILSASSLGAESFRVAVAGESEAYVSLFSSVLSSFSSVGSGKVLALREERREREGEKEKMKRMTEKSRNESFSEEKTAEEEEYTLLDMEKSGEDLSSYLPFLVSGDADAYLYLRNLYSLDAVFAVKSESDGDIERITLLFNGEEIHSAWYNSEMRKSEEALLYSILSPLLLSSDYHVYSLDLTPEDATLSIDGSAWEHNSDYIILKDGEHTFTLSGYGYKSEVHTLSLSGSEECISLSLSPSPSFSLLVTTYPYSADLYFNGIKSGDRFLSSVVTPYVITLDSPSFADYSYQERRQKDHITLFMAPLWTGEKNILERKKSAFYSSLFYTLVSFAGYVASSSVSNFLSSEAGTAMGTVFTGASILSLVNLMQNAVDYYNSAGYGL